MKKHGYRDFERLAAGLTHSGSREELVEVQLGSCKTRRRLGPAVGTGSSLRPESARPLGAGAGEAPPLPAQSLSGPIWFIPPLSGPQFRPAVAWNLPLPLSTPDTTRSSSGPSSVSNCHKAPRLRPSPFHSAHFRLQALFPTPSPIGCRSVDRHHRLNFPRRLGSRARKFRISKGTPLKRPAVQSIGNRPLGKYKLYLYVLYICVSVCACTYILSN